MSHYSDKYFTLIICNLHLLNFSFQARHALNQPVKPDVVYKFSLLRSPAIFVSLEKSTKFYYAFSPSDQNFIMSKNVWPSQTDLDSKILQFQVTVTLKEENSACFFLPPFSCSADNFSEIARVKKASKQCKWCWTTLC